MEFILVENSMQIPLARDLWTDGLLRRSSPTLPRLSSLLPESKSSIPIQKPQVSQIAFQSLPVVSLSVQEQFPDERTMAWPRQFLFFPPCAVTLFTVAKTAEYVSEK